MGYFENNIYIQTAHSCVRNKDILNVNTSSDFCIFTSPTFTMSGTSKIICDNSVLCPLSGQPFNDILTGATDVCFTQQSLSATCLELIHWQTKISEDNSVVYSADFHTSTATTGNLPTDEQFVDSVLTAFDSLGYDYTLSGSTFTIERPIPATQLTIDVCIYFDLTDDCVSLSDEVCSCPSGFTITLDDSQCVFSATTGATFNGSGATIVVGDTNANYSTLGAHFYTNETTNEALPIFRDTNIINLEDQTGGTITYTNVSDTANSFWDSISSTSNGRLNNVGISASTTEFVGFSHCVEILSAETYYIGMAADNQCKFSIDGVPFVELTGVFDRNFSVWHIFPYDFSAGKHIIEMTGFDNGGLSAYAAEIYNPTDLATLTGATTTGETGLIFSTVNKIGDTFDIGTTIGYSCPSGYSLDTCGTAVTCTQLIYTAGTPCVSAFTGTCISTCSIACDEIFSATTTGNSAVHIITTATTQDITFDFTGGTSAFIDTNSTFKYEIFKFDTELGFFLDPPQFRSDEIEWSSFSATSATTQTIPLSTLDIDGEYLVKGYFVHDICTEYSNRLDLRNDTSLIKSGESFGLYEPERDFYMSIFRAAEEPMFDDAGGIGGSILSIKQQVVIPIDGQTVFPLPSDAEADFVVTVNGLSLANGYDYVITQSSAGTGSLVVTLSAQTFDTDIVTFIYASTGAGGLKTDTFDVTLIASGITNGEGNNDIYFNTDTNQYELFLTLPPKTTDDILIMLNGVSLSNGVDYYQSISNPNRIIFTGTILVGDIIVAVYNQDAEFVDSINSPTPTIVWTIANAPILENGKFILEFASDENMTIQVSSAQTNYVVGATTYSLDTIISGAVGTELFYRVKNIKDYDTICGDIIQSTAFSEIVPITIATNSINSY